MWEHRNAALHDKDNYLLQEVYERRIRLQFDMGFEGFPSHTRYQIRQDVEDILGWRLDKKMQWLAQIEAARNVVDHTVAARREARARARLQLERQQNMMRNRFLRQARSASTEAATITLRQRGLAYERAHGQD